MQRIIFDTDNTMGIKGKPMDDGITLLYILGKNEDAKIEIITINEGNGTIDECFNCTKELFDELLIEDIPILKGRNISSFTSQEEALNKAKLNDAAKYIARLVAKNPGEISYLGIGSLTNLYDAFLLNENIFNELKEIVLMGGITKELFIHGDQPLGELNFSIDYYSSTEVLKRAKNISIITGNNCLPVAALPKDEFMDKMCKSDNPAGLFIAQKCGYRFHDKKIIYGADASYCWDIIAATYLIMPHLFSKNLTPCNINEEYMKYGYLNPCDEDLANAHLNIPIAISKQDIQNEIYSGWLDLKLKKKSINFSCTGLYLDKLVQPSILIELKKEPNHGFAILQRLIKDGYVDKELDPAGMYRMLKKMEAAGYIAEESKQTSPKSKKIYRITDYGIWTLENWKDSLKKYTAHINRIIDSI